MQLKIMYQDEKKCTQKCEVTECRQDMLMKVVQALVRPQLAAVIHRILEVQELYQLADITSLGENQLHHTIRMAELADMIGSESLEKLAISKSELMTAVIFHDIGKGMEVDDANYEPLSAEKTRLPKALKKYVPGWIEFKEPLHFHLVRGVELAQTYNLQENIVEAIALHHHAKIYPQVLKELVDALGLAPMICDDVLRHQPEQYAAKSSNLAQVVAILDQLCAIERKFQGRLYLCAEPEKLEDELTKELVIGLANPNDPRLKLLGIEINGRETVILLDLRSFGTFVQLHSEYQVQAVKREVLNTIRSVVRVQDRHRDKDAVGLVGGDEFVIITKVTEPAIIEKMIDRITKAVQVRTGFEFRVGYGQGGSISANFHEARTNANLQKKLKFVT